MFVVGDVVYALEDGEYKEATVVDVCTKGGLWHLIGDKWHHESDLLEDEIHTASDTWHVDKDRPAVMLRPNYDDVEDTWWSEPRNVFHMGHANDIAENYMIGEEVDALCPITHSWFQAKIVHVVANGRKYRISWETTEKYPNVTLPKESVRKSWANMRGQVEEISDDDSGRFGVGEEDEIVEQVGLREFFINELDRVERRIGERFARLETKLDQLNDRIDFFIPTKKRKLVTKRP